MNPEFALKQKLQELVSNELECDVLSNTGTGFISVMSSTKQKLVKADIPAAFEAYSLLSLAMDKYPALHGQLTNTTDTISINRGTVYDESNKRVVTLIPIQEGELEYCAQWLTDNLHSTKAKQFAGTLALCFSIEDHANESHLIPEWFAGFYVESDENRLIPLLSLKSFIANLDKDVDWVGVALERMRFFGLPCAVAQAAM